VTGILDSIDGALSDYVLSDDAMRWQPEGKREPAAKAPRPGEGTDWHLLPGSVVVTDTEATVRAFNDLAAAVARSLDPVVRHLALVSHGVHRALFPGEHRRCWTCRPALKPKPLAVDGHAYQRRLRARRRRNRR
jgi:hypothetical protein